MRGAFIALTLVLLSSTTRVNVYLLDAETQPLKNVRVSLDLHFHEGEEIRGAFSDECITDERGQCTIVIGDTRGLLLRGTLDLGMYGRRVVAWHGGALDVPIHVEQEAEPQLNHATLYSALLILSFLLAGLVIQGKGSQA